MAKNKKGKWITIRGRHIFIPEGQTLDDVLNNKDNHDYEVDTADEEEIKKAQSEEDMKYILSHPEEGRMNEKLKSTYTPKTKTEIAVEDYFKENWDKMDKNKTLGEMAYKLSGYIRRPYPELLDAVSKSVAARNANVTDDYYESELPQDEYEQVDANPEVDVLKSEQEVKIIDKLMDLDVADLNNLQDIRNKLGTDTAVKQLNDSELKDLIKVSMFVKNYHKTT